ncbi:MAG: c-type cytochrome [Lewinellaceae bacterium]|nr:c-type cytochrome [Lewinellaceae bacterium]
MRILPVIFFFALLFGAALVSCRHELVLPLASDNPGGPTDTIPDPPIDTADYSGVPCSPDTVYFQNQVLPLLIASCAKAGCHDAISHKEGVVTVSYSTVMAGGNVKAGNPGGSKLYKVMIDNDPGDRMPPAPDAPLTADQLALVYKWIQQGALNNECNEGWGGCDTTGVGYTNFIAPLMANQCNGCHSGANASGGIKLTTYNEVRSMGLSGQLYGSVAWLNGYKAMPDGGGQMSTCYVNKVKAWVDAGMPQ